ncbi:MAG: hypothetical protein JXR96_26420 [Deltaproteobacteria bacterium]|nr:hypothetical protein [Deltaproteobacteria bacterium]
MKTPTIAMLLASMPLGLPALAGTLEHEIRTDLSSLRLEPAGALWRVELDGYAPAGAPDEPALPARSIRLALPADARLESLRLEVIDLEEPASEPLRGRRIEPGRLLRSLCPGPFACSVVSPSGRRPPGSLLLRSAGKLGPMPVVELLHYPVELDERADRLRIHSRQLVRLRFDTDPARSPRAALRLPHSIRSLARSLVDNAAFRRDHYPPQRDGAASSLAIVTTEAIVSQSEALPDLISAHEAHGHRVHLVTEQDVDAVQGAFPDERPQRLRAWLQANAEALELEHVLIIANPDPAAPGFPMLAADPFANEENHFVDRCPTDAYFADLSGDWDLDADGVFAEYPEDTRPGGVDFLPELHVGRIPDYGSPDKLDRILRQAATYLQARAGTGWRRRILFPGAVLFYLNQDYPGTPRMEGADVAEYMKPEFLEAGFEVTTMYEAKGIRPTEVACDRALSEDELIAEWNRGHGLVYWFGHGSEDAAYRTIWLADTDMDWRPGWWELSGKPFAQSIHHEWLPADMPAFVFHGSCSNGTPESAANIGYTLLKSGAIGTYSSTRVAYGATGADWRPSPEQTDIFMVGYYVISRLRDGRTAGQAIGETRALLADSGYWGSVALHTKLATSLYGDPALELANCSADADCDDGVACNGVETCIGGICAYGETVDCTQLDSDCARGECNEFTGACRLVMLDGQPCDDGLFCTVADTCADGTCQGQARSCEPLSTCQLGVCDEQALACRAERAPDGEDCLLEDGAPGLCSLGVCDPVPGDPSCGCAAGRAHPAGLLALLALLLALRRRRGA